MDIADALAMPKAGGTFTGAVIATSINGRNTGADGSNLDAIQTALGLTAGSTNLGAAIGATVPANSVLLAALQAIVAKLESVPGSRTSVAANIAALTALTGMNSGDICYVQDASGGSVASGAAMYVFDGDGWAKIAEFESLDLPTVTTTANGLMLFADKIKLDRLTVTAAVDLDAMSATMIKKDGSVSFTGVVSGVAPTAPTHLATKAYVDSAAAGAGVSTDAGNQLSTGVDGKPMLIGAVKVDGSTAFTATQTGVDGSAATHLATKGQMDVADALALPKAHVVDDLTTGGAAKVLSAEQGKTLKTGLDATVAIANAALPKAGGTMTGAIVLSGAPTAALEAATKGYVDGALPVVATVAPVMDGVAAVGISAKWATEDHVHPSDTSRIAVADLVDDLTTGGAAKVLSAEQGKTLKIGLDATASVANAALPKAGGALTGPLVLAADPSVALGAVTKQYVDTAVTSSGASIPGTAVPLPHGVADVGASAKWAHEDHVHAMPRLDQAMAPTADVALNAQKITGLANGVAAQDAAAFSQIPVAATAAPVMDGVATPGVSLKFAKEDHAHPTDVSLIPKVDIVDDLVTGGATKVLSAGQGAILLGLTKGAFTPLAANATHALDVGTKYLAGNNAVLNFPAGAADGAQIAIAPAGAAWSTSGVSFVGAGADTVADGQPAITAVSDVITFIKSGTNWMAAVGSVAPVSSVVVDDIVTGGSSSALSAQQGVVLKGMVDTKLPLVGGALTGPLAMGSSKITGLANGTLSTDAAALGQVPVVATAPPAMDGVAAVGASTKFATEDHVHPSDTSKVDKAGSTMTGPLILSGAPTIALHAASKGYVDSKLLVVADLTTLDNTTVAAGQTVTVLDVGGGKFASFLFPTSGQGNQVNRSLIATDQVMSNSNFSSAAGADMASVNTDYIVQTVTFTSPVGAKRAAVMAWCMIADESTNDQLVRMFFKMTKVSGSVVVFNPAARPRMSISGGTSPDIVDRRTVQLMLTDSEISVESATQYRIDLIAQKAFATGPTKFREGLIKADWRG
jgi:hypothetical protein